MIQKIGLYHDPRKKRPWVVRWFGEYDPASGKQRRYSKAFRLKVEAEDFGGPHPGIGVPQIGHEAHFHFAGFQLQEEEDRGTNDKTEYGEGEGHVPPEECQPTPNGGQHGRADAQN